MLREAFRYFNDETLSLIGLIIFVVFFIGLLIWVFLPSQKKYLNKMKHLPLQEDEKQTGSKENEHE